MWKGTVWALVARDDISSGYYIVVEVVVLEGVENPRGAHRRPVTLPKQGHVYVMILCLRLSDTACAGTLRK